MLYQVATSGLAPADIAAPIRDTLYKYKKNTTVLMAEVTGVDAQQQLVFMQDQPPLHYDYLMLATGASTNYFGHPEWESISPGMKTLADALEVQQTRVLRTSLGHNAGHTRASNAGRLTRPKPEPAGV